MARLHPRMALAVALAPALACTVSSCAAPGTGLRWPRQAVPAVGSPEVERLPASAPVLLPPLEDPEPVAAASDSAGVARLLRLTELWHLLSLHHPAVIDRGVALDSAFIKAATLVRRATTRGALDTAYSRFLAVLQDPLSRVEAEGRTASVLEAPPSRILQELTGDSVLVLRFPTAASYDPTALAVVREALTRPHRHLILDLRATHAGAHPDSVDAFLWRAGVPQQLAPFSVRASGVRVRRIGGGRLVDGAWTVDDAWVTHDGPVITPVAPAALRSTRRVMILANAQTVLSPSLLGLLAAGRASLIAEGAVRDDALAPQQLFPIGEGLVVRVRTGDIVNADGTRGIVPDTLVAVAPTLAAMDSTPAFQVALRALRSGQRVRATRSPVASAPPPLPRFYDADPYPFMGARLLAGARLWSTLRARHAHRDLADDDLDAAFARAIPALEAARYAPEYAAALQRLAGVSDDAQVRLYGASLDTAIGVAQFPFRVQWIEGRALITEVMPDSVTRALGIEPWQEVTAVDGFPLTAWLQEHRSSVAAPNEWTRPALLMEALVRGPAGGALVRLRDIAGRERQLTIPRRTGIAPQLSSAARATGTVSLSLPQGIAYIDVNRLTSSTIEAALARHRTARAWILDLRGAFPDSAILAERLIDAVRRTPSAVQAREWHRYQATPCLAPSIREAAAICPETREQRTRRTTGDTANHFPGLLVALIDERTTGAMERLALMLEATTAVTFIGSPTAGSPAETMTWPLPGGLTFTVPVFELRRADGSQWQRVGITPVLDARLTVRTVRSGGDDVRDRAVQWLQQQLAEPVRRRR